MRFVVRFRFGERGRDVAHALEHFGRRLVVDAVAGGDLSATGAAEALVERDDSLGARSNCCVSGRPP